MTVKADVYRLLDEAVVAKVAARDDAAFVGSVAKAAQLIAKVARAGGTVYACGNGGSACDAMHLCEELVARFKRTRPGIRAMHFLDAGTMSCWGNDFSFDTAFERYAETFCTQRDVLIAISTSGTSNNILAAAQAATRQGCPVIALTGKGGGSLRSHSDIAVIVPETTATERVQEVHITAIHIWCELLETALATPSKAVGKAKKTQRKSS